MTEACQTQGCVILRKRHFLCKGKAISEMHDWTMRLICWGSPTTRTEAKVTPNWRKLHCLGTTKLYCLENKFTQCSVKQFD